MGQLKEYVFWRAPYPWKKTSIGTRIIGGSIMTKYLRKSKQSTARNLSSFLRKMYLSRIYSTFRSAPPILHFTTRLQFSVHLFKCNQLSYFLSAYNIYCRSISNRFFDTVYLHRIQYIPVIPPLLTFLPVTNL